MIEHLEETCMDKPSAFFYCDFRTERSTNATEVIRSLLYQLLDQYRRGTVKLGALRVVDELEEERRKGNATLRDITRLSSLVSRVAEQFNQQPFLVIDALDECKDIDDLFGALHGLKTKGVRLFVSSRPIQIIKHKLKGLASISVDKMAKELSADIKLHVNKEVESHPRLGLLNPGLKKKVCSTLCQKADGMFVYTYLALSASHLIGP